MGFALDNLMDDSDTPRGFNSAIERSIMQRIEDDTNRMIDRRIAQETNYNKKTKMKLKRKLLIKMKDILVILNQMRI